jgi:hypothetical protein
LSAAQFSGYRRQHDSFHRTRANPMSFAILFIAANHRY